MIDEKQDPNPEPQPFAEGDATPLDTDPRPFAFGCATHPTYDMRFRGLADARERVKVTGEVLADARERVKRGDE